MKVNRCLIKTVRARETELNRTSVKGGLTDKILYVLERRMLESNDEIYHGWE